MDTLDCRGIVAPLSRECRVPVAQPSLWRSHAGLARRRRAKGGALLRDAAMRYHAGMSNPVPLIEDDEDAAEAQALAAAIAESDADPRTAPHEDVRAWLLRLANGEFDAPPPEPC